MRSIKCLSGPACVILLAVSAGSLACSEEPQTPQEKTKSDKPTQDHAADPGEPLVIPAFAFGPYTIDPVEGGASFVFIETGFFDRRETKGDGDADIFDRRDRHAAVALLPTSAAQSPGCTAVLAVTATASGLGPYFTGDLDEKLTVKSDGVWRFEDDNEASSFDIDGAHEIAFTKDGEQMVTLPDGPSYSGLQLAGAFDANLTINTNLGDINTALANSSDDLLLGDAGSGEDYDIAVVTFHGGSAAKTAQLRCVFAPGEAVTVTPDDYKGVLPIRRLAGLVAKLGPAADSEIAPWRARFSGQSVEDLRVP